MNFHGNYKMLPIAAALVLATIGASAQAATEAWVNTATQAPRIPASTTHLNAMTAGAPTHVVVSLNLRNKADLDTLTNNIMAGRVTHPITSAQFMASYAPTQAQAQAVADHLTRSGFRNVTISDNRMLVSADGTTTSVKTGFNTDIHTYDVGGRAAFANISAAAVPQSLSKIVLAVHGLQTVHLHHVMMAKPNGVHTNTVSGHSPTDFAAIYNASSLPSAINAKIGIITQGSMTQTVADLRTFASNKGFPAPNITTVTVGAASSDTAGVGEWNMDTQDALATAGGTINQMILYTANTLSDADLTSTYNRAVGDNVAKSINVSLGECETDAQSSGIMASNDQIFQTAVAQGQTFSVSSGDSGSYECGGPGNSASYPSVSPYVMSIGGSLLNTSGTTYQSESVWACTTAAQCQQSAGGGAGGAPSLTEAAPSWQINAGVLGTSTKRGTPDISFDADPNSGALVLISGANQQIGGTSLAAPIFTGFWARVQSMNNNTLAFPAAAIYQKAATTPGMFHDITSGANGGETAKAGWDYASGYGSLNMANFAAAMGNSGPACNATVINGSATTCTAAGLPNYTGTAYTHMYSTYTGGGSCTPAVAPGYDTSGCTAPQGTALSNGVAVTGISLAAGANKMYTFVVPAGQTSLTFDTSGGSGDADLYVKLGSAPTTSVYLQKSDGSTTTEHIAITNPAAGTYYVMVNGYAASSGVSLVAKYAAGSTNVLTNGVPVTGLAGSAGSSKVYTLVVPAGRPSVTFKTTGGSGDADLFVQVGSAPTTSSYLKSSEGSTTTETVTITSPAAGTYYVMVYGYATYSGVTLTGSD